MESSRMTNPQQVLDFLLAGKATITLFSKVTGTRFTYRVIKKRMENNSDLPLYFVSLLTGQDNESDYSYLGTIFPNTALLSDWRCLTRFRSTTKSRISPNAPSFRAFGWMLSHVLNGKIPSTLEVWHEGRCGCCGRKLTTPESIASGIGPVCGNRRAA
jgi:hypothetical protein